MKARAARSDPPPPPAAAMQRAGERARGQSAKVFATFLHKTAAAMAASLDAGGKTSSAAWRGGGAFS